LPLLAPGIQAESKQFKDLIAHCNHKKTSISSSSDWIFLSIHQQLSPPSANKFSFAFFRFSKRDLHNDMAFAQYGITSPILDANS
jgi:hypothetical protein